MTYKKLIPASLILATIGIVFLSSGCTQKTQNVEKPVATPTPVAAAGATPTPFPKLPPPNAAEVREAMQRVFGDDLSFTPEPGNFIVADLNGDGSEDIAVVARPAAPGKLVEINSEVANWIIQDARQAVIPSPKQTVVKLPKVESPKVHADETLLAIIHGYGATGWRNPQARQAFLIKNAAGQFEGITSSISERAIRAMHLPVETDVIKVVRQNKKGLVFWTGGTYAWHPRQG